MSQTQPADKRRPQKRSGGPQRHRRPDPYAEPDTGGVIARSNLPRFVVLALDPTDAQRLVTLLGNSPADAKLKQYVADKIERTAAYNKALPGAPVSAKASAAPTTTNVQNTQTKRPARRRHR